MLKNEISIYKENGEKEKKLFWEEYNYPIHSMTPIALSQTFIQETIGGLSFVARHISTLI